MIVPVRTVGHFLDELHYLGAAHRGEAWSDEDGVVVLGPPTSRYLPRHWLELSRWCLIGRENSGSEQWARVRRHILAAHPLVTTVVSYSDPAAGHDGALYRACGWLWAPTWHRLRPPPTGGGSWTLGEQQAVKDRWVDCLRPDAERARALTIDDDACMRRFPEAIWREPDSRRGRIVRGTGGCDYAAWSVRLSTRGGS